MHFVNIIILSIFMLYYMLLGKVYNTMLDIPRILNTIVEYIPS